MRNLFYSLLALLAFPAHAEETVANGKAYLFTLSYDEVEAAVSAALSDKGAGDKVAARINGHGTDPVFSYSAPLAIELRGLTFDKPSGHWSANLLAVSGGQVITAAPASGRFDVLAEVPVLKRTMRRGEVIEAKDIEIRDVPMAQTRSDTLTDMDSLIGKSPEHSVSAYRPIRAHEIVSPAVVKKNSLVQMRYRSPGMEITTSGQALEDGAQGEAIAVRNLASKKTVQARVEDSGLVSITSPDTRHTASAGENHATN